MGPLWMRVLGALVINAALTGSESYTMPRTSIFRPSGRNAMLEIRSIHEGLLVQMESLNKAIKDDQLKLNNVFYKLGRHDTDLATTTSAQIRLRDASKNLESKLNKHAFNVDFLRRHMTELKRSVETSSSTSARVSSLQETVKDLQTTLAQALYRTEMLENKTGTLKEPKQSPATEDKPKNSSSNDMFYSGASTSYYYLNTASASRSVCPELEGWSNVPGSGCWFLGVEKLPFLGAVAACVQKGGVLAMTGSRAKLPNVITDKLRDSPGARYWTSGTDAFTPGQWYFLYSGAAVTSHDWAPGIYGLPTIDLNCAVLSKDGLEPQPCMLKYPYLCERLP